MVFLTLSYNRNLSKVIERYRCQRIPARQKTFPRCPMNFGASLFDIAETSSKLTRELRCVQYKREASALLQQRFERTQKKAQN